MPFIANAFDEPNVFELTFRLGDTDYPYSFVLAQAISFVVVAGLIWLAVKWLEDETQDCPYCMSVIPVDAFACAYCTREVREIDEDDEVPCSANE